MKEKEKNLYAVIDNRELFKEFKAILAVKDISIKDVLNKFVKNYVKENK